MSQAVKSNNSSTNMNAGADSQPAASPTPEAVVEQLKALAATFGEVAVLTVEEKRKIRHLAEMPDSVVEAQIGLIDTHERVESAVGLPSDDARQIGAEAKRWKAVEDQLKYMLTASPERISSAVRRWRSSPRRRR